MQTCEGKTRTYLNTVVSVRIPEKLLQARAVQELANEHLAGIVLGDTDTLKVKISQAQH